jgi:hypothetical protein
LCGKAQYVTKIDRHRREADIVIHLFQEERKVQVGLKVPKRLTAEEYRQMKATA